MIALERAFARGHVRATVKGEWDRQEREYRRRHMPTQTGHVNVAGWEQLATLWSQTGNVIRGGERLVQT